LPKALAMSLRRLLPLCVLVLLTACKQSSEVKAIVQGSPTVAISSLQILPGTGDNAPAGGDSVYYVCKVVFTNTTGSDLTPSIDHFVFATNQEFTVDKEHPVYHALIAGIPTSISIDISNPAGPLKAGDKQEYTLVFRTALGATGTIDYQL
jgi:hypothetical protein